MVKLYNWDCLEVMKTLPDNSIDSIITDPPYWLSFMGNKWDYDVPSQEIWEEALRVLKPWWHLLSFSWTRTYHRMVVRIEDAWFEIRDMVSWIYWAWFPKSLNIEKSMQKQWIDNYEQWEWRWTALKPATEPIVLARKPISEKNIAKNVDKRWVGGINIDDCRVAYNWETPNVWWRWKHSRWDWYGFQAMWDDAECNMKGRFPANVIHDWSVEVVELFPIQSKHSASRFFYCAKPSQKERNMWVQQMADGKGNTHPTIKPIKLMEYLIKLVTHPDWTVLDPFMWSGTTGIACHLLNRSFIGIEMSKEYYDIASKRIASFAP